MIRIFAVLTLVGALTAPASPGLDHPEWLCLPGMAANPCNQDLMGDPQTGGDFTAGYPESHGRVNLDTSRVESGSVAVEPFGPPASPPVDCFSVYPTVDIVPNPLLQLGSLPPSPQDAEQAVTLAQVGPLLARCRMFVPVYRQASLAAHVVGVLARTSPDYALGLSDVEQAWDTYWRDYNIDPVTHRRRGVVVLGHSQGAADASRLISDRIDGNPAVQPYLVSALLLGGNIPVPVDRPAGGGADPDSAFQYVPVCSRPSPSAPVPVGCVAGYSAYKQPGDAVPAPDALFGLSSVPGHRILCVNPAALVSGAAADSAVPLDMRIPTSALVEGSPLLPGGHLAVLLLGTPVPSYPTGYARYPGLVSGQCLLRSTGGGNASWLQVRGGDAVVGSAGTGAGMGLHVKDFNLSLGDMVTLVRAQTREWLRSHG